MQKPTFQLLKENGSSVRKMALVTIFLEGIPKNENEFRDRLKHYKDLQINPHEGVCKTEVTLREPLPKDKWVHGRNDPKASTKYEEINVYMDFRMKEIQKELIRIMGQIGTKC